MSKDATPFILIALGVAGYFMFKSKSQQSAIPMFVFDSSLNLSSRQVQALNALQQELIMAVDPNTGQALSSFQVQLLMAQALHESGILQQSPNWTMIDGNNFAGIKAHGSYPANSKGVYALYSDLATFVADWISILNWGSQPLEQITIENFCQALKDNHYYEDTVTAYQADVSRLYNWLSTIYK